MNERSNKSPGVRAVVVVDGPNSLVKLSDGSILEGVHKLDMEIYADDLPQLHLTIVDFEVQYVRAGEASDD